MNTNRGGVFNMKLWRNAALLLYFLILGPVVDKTFAQAAPEIMTAYENDVTVDGAADPSAGPISIVDVSYTVETIVGTGEVSPAGTFTAVVKPALIKGNRIVAVDKNGRRSAAFTVAPARPEPPPGSTRQ
jgi:hypothetical protein